MQGKNNCGKKALHPENKAVEYRRPRERDRLVRCRLDYTVRSIIRLRSTLLRVVIGIGVLRRAVKPNAF